MEKAKKTMRLALPVALVVAVLALGGVATGCSSSKSSTMYERQQSNKARKVKSNIKVKGNNRANSHTTRSY